MDDGLAFAGLRGRLESLAAGEVTSLELVEHALERIEATQATLNAFRCVRVDAAREEAHEADRRIARGERLPLLGVPVAIKDDTDLAGETTPFGCRGTFARKDADAEVVRRLKAAGAVVVGKTTTPEFGQWPITEGPAFGVTRIPWSLEHTPVGSSGGSAAALAFLTPLAAILPWELGTKADPFALRSDRTGSDRSGCRPRGRTWSESSPSAGASRPGRKRNRSTG